MALKVSVNKEGYPKDEPISIGGGLAVPNGGHITLSEDDEIMFAASTGAVVKDFFRKKKIVKVEGTAEVKKTDLPEGGVT